MSALQRQQTQVAFLLRKGYVSFPEASGDMGLFTCKSVAQPAVVTYDGCIGELFCTCPVGEQCQYACKHLEAAATNKAFTHAMRLAAAHALVDKLEEVDLECGIAKCRQVQLPLHLIYIKLNL
jgi:hypothetical protein